MDSKKQARSGPARLRAMEGRGLQELESRDSDILLLEQRSAMMLKLRMLGTMIECGDAVRNGE